MGRWLVPLLLAVLVLPSVMDALSSGAALLTSDGYEGAGEFLLDALRAGLALALALAVLQLLDGSRPTPIRLLDRRVLLRRDALAGSGPAGEET